MRRTKAGWGDDRGSHLAPLGILLYPGRGVRYRAAVPLLLDDHHHAAAGQRTVPSVERGQLRAVLDDASDPGTRSLPADRNHVRHMDADHDADLARGDRNLAVLRAAGGL